MGVFSREPAVIIGIIASCVIAVVQTLVEKGVLTADTGQTALNVIGVFVPLIVAIVTRFVVYSPATVKRLTSGR